MRMSNEGHCMEMNMYDEDMDEMMYDEDMDEMMGDHGRRWKHVTFKKGMGPNMNMNMMETKKGGCGCKKENIQLQETKKAYNTVKAELNEVNLLNSKLLYVNRIFKANNLSEAQKLRVVETLDKAESVKEAKLIYETVKDTFTISKKKKTTPKKEVISESNDMVARFKKLANIKINE